MIATLFFSVHQPKLVRRLCRGFAFLDYLAERLLEGFGIGYLDSISAEDYSPAAVFDYPLGQF